MIISYDISLYVPFFRATRDIITYCLFLFRNIFVSGFYRFSYQFVLHAQYLIGTDDILVVIFVFAVVFYYREKSFFKQFNRPHQNIYCTFRTRISHIGKNYNAKTWPKNCIYRHKTPSSAVGKIPAQIWGLLPVIDRDLYIIILYAPVNRPRTASSILDKYIFFTVYITIVQYHI